MNNLPKALDTKDFRILEQLQRDGKLTNAELASRVRLSPSPCWSRVHALEAAGVVTGYVALVDPAKVGMHVSVFIQVSLEKQIESALENFEAAITRYPEVMECYLMTGDSDYLIRVVVPDVRALEQFIVHGLTKIRGVANIRSSFALKQVKYTTALPLRVPK
ncbi:MAG: Lrp/AsnC family transcriptional regulator [Steroidobacteraceae bacterium]|nr:Lrp/AsnC family transcriptional regulator [Steroidobacteraceae bacterium]